MPYIDLNDICMYYDDTGSGVPLVLLNGATLTNETDWRALRSSLTNSYRVLHIEHRGHGRTDNPAGRITFDLLAGDVVALIESLELAPVHIVGFIDGGITALTIGMRQPELLRSIVAVGANFRIDDHVRAAIELLDADIIEQHEPEYAELLAAFHDPHHEPGYWRTMVRHNAENLLENPAYSEDDLRQITAPTLLITGESDLACNISQILAMKRSIPNSEMLLVNHADADWVNNHTVHDTRAEVVGPVILDFLARHTRN
jgi:pimeloyl-ACP methyl ester carboxylesterase